MSFLASLGIAAPSASADVPNPEISPAQPEAIKKWSADPNHRLTNTSLIFGDYYLLEALLDYRRATTRLTSSPR